MDQRTTRRVKALFAQIDKKILALKATTGLECPRCAGHCCKNNYIEVTPLDVLPVVLHFYKTGKLEGLLKKLQNNISGCIFFSKRQTDIKNCHCRIYFLRPSNCRLFGFAVVRNKRGEAKIATCKVQKNIYGDVISAIETDKKFQKLITCYSDVSMRIYNIEPTWGSQHMHINEAIKMVGEKILFMEQISGSRIDRDRTPRRVA